MMSKVSKVSDIRLNVRGEDHFCHWHHFHYVFVNVKPYFLWDVCFEYIRNCTQYLASIILVTAHNHGTGFSFIFVVELCSSSALCALHVAHCTLQCRVETEGEIAERLQFSVESCLSRELPIKWSFFQGRSIYLLSFLQRDSFNYPTHIIANKQMSKI